MKRTNENGSAAAAGKRAGNRIASTSGDRTMEAWGTDTGWHRIPEMFPADTDINKWMGEHEWHGSWNFGSPDGYGFGVKVHKKHVAGNWEFIVEFGLDDGFELIYVPDLRSLLEFVKTYSAVLEVGVKSEFFTTQLPRYMQALREAER
jgi:hypothetical protein